MKSIVFALFLAGCGSVDATPICISPATYVPAYQSCPGSFDGMPCVTRIGHQTNEAGATLPVNCIEEDTSTSFVVAGCGECR